MYISCNEQKPTSLKRTTISLGPLQTTSHNNLLFQMFIVLLEMGEVGVD